MKFTKNDFFKKRTGEGSKLIENINSKDWSLQDINFARNETYKECNFQGMEFTRDIIKKNICKEL